MERESMVFYRSFYDGIKDLPDEELAKAFRVLAEYGLNGIELECTGIAKVVLAMAKPQIDKNNIRYENGKKGGRPPVEKPNHNQTETKPKPNETKPKPNETKPEPNVNVNVNDNVNDNVNKKKDSKESKEKVHFVPPTLENVIGYCREKGLNVDAQRFIDFYECKGWMVGKNKMKDWKAAVRNWARTEKKTTKFHNFSEHTYALGELDKLFEN